VKRCSINPVTKGVAGASLCIDLYCIIVMCNTLKNYNNFSTSNLNYNLHQYMAIIIRLLVYRHLVKQKLMKVGGDY